jgi:hypothetical protein
MQMVFPRQAPTLLAMTARRDARLDDELAFIEVSNALATLAAKQPRSRPLSPRSPWVLTSASAVPDLPLVEAPPSSDRSYVLIMTALLATLVGLPIAALGISFLY